MGIRKNGKAEDLGTRYDPKGIEEKWYRFWEERGYFTPKGRGEKFSIVIPPPNITGRIHMGHALNITIQDIIVRYKRMQGFDTLWLPGEDHAGIATQNAVERELLKQGKTREDLGREKFLRIVWDWAKKYRKEIAKQIRALGASCDWTRERFTLDENLNLAVRKVFVDLYKKGLIYKGKYIVNWCPRCGTVLSDEEVEYEEEMAKLYYIKYPFEDGSGHVEIATVRPETMLGDTAVAVHPDDERYKGIVGKYLVLPLVGRRLKIIADKYVDPSFGTGALKVTPAHDPNDYLIAMRHNLEFVEVIDRKGYMNENAGKYEGLDRYEARKKIVEDLKVQGYLVKEEDYKHSIGKCYRCGTVVEPLLSDQWFVKMKPLAEPAIKVVEEGKIRFYPQRWKNFYLRWMYEIRDWCISRQLWWGHRIPVWYCEDCGYMNVSIDEPNRCERCGSTNLKQDDDVLDTWFSSALWPFSTFGWPNMTEDLKRYYPTDLLVTGFDIIFFWVARMIIQGLEFMKDIPFRDVYIHQLVRDKYGRKMSKSLGNGIDPLDMIEIYGADSVRFTLAILAAQGRDIKLDPAYFEVYRKFVNKIWNASRFVFMNLEDYEKIDVEPEDMKLEDGWILTKLKRTVESVTKNLEEYDLNLSARTLYDFFWGDLCDWYIEAVKPRLRNGGRDRKIVQNILVRVLDVSLRLLHPFMPFVTEELWQRLPEHGESITIAKWPRSSDFRSYEGPFEKFEKLMLIVRGVRNVRADMDMPQTKKVKVNIVSRDEWREIIREEYDQFVALANLSGVDFICEKPKMSASAYVDEELEVYVKLEDVDVEKERNRIKKKIEKLIKEREKRRKKLSNPDFLERAPKEIVESERRILTELNEKIGRMEKIIEEIA
ncbi:MAG: valine--tRNA ligase [Thermotogae bacterium]|nr:valine--tRNA ligase [Thermotogota bacterium]